MSETAFTPGPWEFVPGTEHHGPYVSAGFYGDVCDCYTMSDPQSPSKRNGGFSRPIWFHGKRANANAALIAAAPDMWAQHDVNIVNLEMLLKAVEAGAPLAELQLRISDIIRHSRNAIAKATGAA